MNQKIIVVDDDHHLLAAIERNLHHKFQLVTAAGGEKALECLAQDGPFAVIVADMQMPGMDGVQLLSCVQQRHPDTVRFMLTGNADQHTAILAVNQGRVFQFLTKPCPMEVLTAALEAGLKQYQLVTAERELLEKTLHGSLRVLTEVLSIADPLSFGRGQMLRDYMRAYVCSLGGPDSWELEVAAMLSPLGTVAVPPVLLEKFHTGQPLLAAEKEILDRMPQNGADLLAHIPRLETVARIVLYQQKHYNGTGFPCDHVRGDDLPIGSRILKVLIDLLELEAQKLSKDTALNLMQKRPGWYDPRVLDATFACFDIYLTAVSPQYLGEAIPVKELKLGQTLAADIQTQSGITVVPAHNRITPIHLLRIENFARFSPIQEPVYVEPGVQAGPANPHSKAKEREQN